MFLERAGIIYLTLTDSHL